MHSSFRARRLGWAAIGVSLASCGGPPPTPGDAPPPQVRVMTMHAEPVTLTSVLPGRTTAFLIAEVRPQVNGIVKRRRFVEGGTVQAGEVLYDLDDSVYRAQSDSAKAGLQKAQAVLKVESLAAARSSRLARTGVVSAQDDERAAAALGQAEADVASAQAAVSSSAINLGYAHIVAPIGGRIGKSTVTQGALVQAGQANALATIQQLDPIYVEVSQTSTEWLTLKRDLDAGRVKFDRGAAPARIMLENGEPYPHPGKIQFADVTVDPATGTLLMRAIVPNPEATLLPGMYVRAVLDEGRIADAVLAPQVAVTRDPQGEGTVWIVKPDGKAGMRAVRVSRTMGDRWLVEQGLAPGDRLIVEGVQRLEPDLPVTATEQTVASVPAAAIR